MFSLFKSKNIKPYSKPRDFTVYFKDKQKVNVIANDFAHAEKMARLQSGNKSELYQQKNWKE
jgi:hypothetical protein